MYFPKYHYAKLYLQIYVDINKGVYEDTNYRNIVNIKNMYLFKYVVKYIVKYIVY